MPILSCTADVHRLDVYNMHTIDMWYLSAVVSAPSDVHKLACNVCTVVIHFVHMHTAALWEVCDRWKVVTSTIVSQVEVCDR